MSTLKELFERHEGRLIHKWHHYFDVYERYFSRYRGTPVNILEIGISHGGSLQLWREYFGPEANIFAVDINAECKQFEEGKTKVIIGSQEDESFLESLKAQLPPLDILLDDGGHTMKQQILTFNHLFSTVKDGGVYMVEDTHTSYWKEYHGGLHNRGSFIEFSKDLVDQLYAWHIDDPSKMPISQITEHLDSIAFYDSIVVFEKQKRQEPSHSMKGAPTITPYVDPTLKRDSLLDKLRKKLGPNKTRSFFRQLKK